MSEIKISVIIPTYNDWPGLYECIESLRKQTLPKSQFEVIVADNNSEPSLHEDLNDFVTMIHVPKPGSYAARNEALKLCKGEYIALTDSDCVVSPVWLENGLKILESQKVRVAGKITLYDRDKNGFSLAACFEKGFAFNQKQSVKQGVCVTANLMIHRSFIEMVGNFDDSLLSGGDIEWNRRADSKGIPIIYSDNVEVFHPIRATMKEILKKRRRVVGGAYRELNSLGYLKLIVPPFKAIPLLIEKNNMSFGEKIISWMVCYYLKLFSFGMSLLMKLKITQPTRS